jgi:hypothetical protein
MAGQLWISKEEWEEKEIVDCMCQFGRTSVTTSAIPGERKKAEE